MLLIFVGTIFAYGQTSAGKTFTMQGNSDNPGLIPLAITYIFERLQSYPSREFTIKASYMEIYNEVITDLVNATNTNLKIHETNVREVYVGNLTEVVVENGDKALAILSDGQINRTIGRTNMNEYSSRSHTIYRMVVESREKDLPITPGKSRIPVRAKKSGAFRQAVLNFVDLAGSERVRQTGNEGVRLREGGHINKSLLSLTSVISKLAEGSPHIPYRDSKLTRILQNSLGGNARTTIICAITPLSQFVDESLSTLKFASRAKSIENKPTVNEIVSDEVRLRRYEKEIEDLKGRLQQRKRRRSLTTDVDLIHLQSCIQAIASEIADMSFIFEHVEADARCHTENTIESVKASIKQFKDQVDFLSHEKQALEHALAESRDDKDELIVELKTNNRYLTEQLQNINNDRFGETTAHPPRGACIQCPKYRTEIAQLNEMVGRLEAEYDGWMAGTDIKTLLEEKGLEIKNRQADIDELLARSATQQSEWRSKNEALIREVEQLKQTLEWETERVTKFHEQSQQSQNELRSLRTFQEDGAKELVRSLAENNELKVDQERLQKELVDGRTRIANLLADLEQANTRIEKFNAKEQELVKQLREVTTSLTSASTDVQSKAATIALLESQLSQLREDRALIIARNIEESQKQAAQIDQLKMMTQQGQLVEAELQQTRKQVEELQVTILSKTEEAHTIFKQLNERLSVARGEADKRVDELEAVKRQKLKIEEEFRCDIEKYERDLQESIQIKSTLQSKLDKLTRENGEALLEKDVLLEKLRKTEIALAQSSERITSLESQLSILHTLQAENTELRKQQKQSTSTGAEIALRIELDRLSRTLTKERKLFELQMSEMRDQILHHQTPSNFDEIEQLKAEKTELTKLLAEERAKKQISPRLPKSTVTIPEMTPFKKSLTLQVLEDAPTPKRASPENIKPVNIKTPAALNECKQQ